MAQAARRIGEVLIEDGVLTEATVSRALGFQKSSGDRLRLGTILLTWDLLEEQSLLAGLAKLHRCPAVPWSALSAASVETVHLLSAAHAFRLGAVPYALQRNAVHVAFANPSDIRVVDETAALIGRRIVPGVTSEIRLLQAQRQFYGRHVPLEYRGIFQKLDRRPTRTTPRPVGRETDAGAPVAPVPTPDTLRDDRVVIPIATESRPEILVPEMPELEGGVLSFPAPEKPAVHTTRSTEESAPREDAPVPIEEIAEDSLSEWVGEALAAFTGEPAEASVSAAPMEGPKDEALWSSDSPAGGVADPSIFGRSEGRTPDVRDDFPDELSLALPLEEPARAEDALPPAEDELSPLTDEHRRGVPDSIPPFRRAGDPVEPFARPYAAFSSPAPSLDREEGIVAGMWKPAPDEAPGPDPVWDGSAYSAPTDARSRDELADSVLRDSLASIPRVMLLGAGRTGAVGWRGRGRGLSPERVAAIRVPHAEISVFSAVQQSGVPHFAVTERAEWPRALADLFGPKPLDCAIFPVRVLDSVAAFLYADRLGEPMQYEDFALIARAAANAAGVLSRFLIPESAPDPTVGS